MYDAQPLASILCGVGVAQGERIDLKPWMRGVSHILKSTDHRAVVPRTNAPHLDKMPTVIWFGLNLFRLVAVTFMAWALVAQFMSLVE